MTFYLSRFGNDAELVLPKLNHANSMGTFATATTATQTVGRGGPFDLYGLDDAPTGPTVFYLRGTLFDADPEDLEEDYRELLSYRGKLRRLFRTWPDSDLSEWSYARLMQVNVSRNPNFTNTVMDASIAFEMRSPNWNGARHGAGWELDSGEYLDSGLDFDDPSADLFALTTTTTDITTTNAGNVAVSLVTVTVTAGDAAITSLTMRDTAVPADLFTFNGTIAATKTAVFNFATKRFTNDGANAYADFARSATNPFEQWINIRPGTAGQPFRITRVGGGTGSELTLNYYDGHA